MNLDVQAGRRRGARVAVLAFAVLFAAGPAVAQSPTQDRPDNPGGRYVFHRADDALLRLDRASGEVSSCIKQDAGWACYAVADERAALDAEIARLRSENVRLKEALLARNIPLPGRDAGGASAGANVNSDKPGDRTADAKPSSGASIEIRGPGLDRIQEFAGAAWKRVVELFRDVR